MSGFDVQVQLERVSPRSPTFDLDVGFDSGEGITVIAGPSGAGKSTLLLAIVGALRPRAGKIRVAGHTVFDSTRSIDLPIRTRSIGMVFQDALLFPHMDALHNVKFALPVGAHPERARELLEQVGAAELSALRSLELSGGQRQRVALARSLAASPSALLLDEPFSALDRVGRLELGNLLIELQRAQGIPFLHVTHDLAEAVRLGHHLVLLDRGRVVQSGVPIQVVSEPSTIAAARTVGTENLLKGRVLAHCAEQGWSEIDLGGTRIQTGLLEVDVGDEITVGLRAEDILVCLEPVAHTSARNLLSGRIAAVHEQGAAIELRVTTPVSFRVLLTPISMRELGLEIGKPVYLLIKAAAFRRVI